MKTTPGVKDSAPRPFFAPFWHSCALCRAPCQNAVCAPCRQDIARLAAPSRCLQCAAPASAPACGECLRNPPAFDRTFAALDYAPPLSALVQDFKFRGQWQTARFLAQLARAPEADMLLPVPLFFARERWRGFNQARELARALPAPVPPRREDILMRITETRQQSLLTAPERLKNVRGAFAVQGDVRGKTILVLDDVMSSGATLNETARVLKKAGAAKVINLVIARASFNASF